MAQSVSSRGRRAFGVSPSLLTPVRFCRLRLRLRMSASAAHRRRPLRRPPAPVRPRRVLGRARRRLRRPRPRRRIRGLRRRRRRRRGLAGDLVSLLLPHPRRRGPPGRRRPLLRRRRCRWRRRWRWRPPAAGGGRGGTACCGRGPRRPEGGAPSARAHAPSGQARPTITAMVSRFCLVSGGARSAPRAASTSLHLWLLGSPARSTLRLCGFLALMGSRAALRTPRLRCRPGSRKSRSW